jgi:lipopolysaccharide/colanic/teichoic acid biosynthesis glycosyltransferase
MYKKFLKRILEFIAAILGILLLSPLYLIVAVILFFTNNGNVFFRQPRPGKNEVVFYVYKFKSMSEKKDASGILLSDEKRLTKIGIFIRKTSLDELPQLFNVLKGDMSFIGPRPLLIRYLPFYTPKERIRHSVRPGITGLAQISGRNNLNWDDRLQKDVFYVENLSFKNDVKIIFKTVAKVILRENINVAAGATNIDLDEYRK